MAVGGTAVALGATVGVEVGARVGVSVGAVVFVGGTGVLLGGGGVSLGGTGVAEGTTVGALVAVTTTGLAVPVHALKSRTARQKRTIGRKVRMDVPLYDDGL